MFRNTSIIKKDKEKLDDLSEMNSINLDTLPPEILAIIVTLLSDKDLVNLSLVNKKLNGATKEAIDDRFIAFMPQLDKQYKKIHDDNKSLREVVSAQLVADRTLCQHMMLMLATCGFRETYTGETINDRMLRRGFGMSIVTTAGFILMCMTMGLTFLLITYMDNFRDKEENEKFLSATLVAALITFTITAIMACIMNGRLMLRMCRNGSDYAMSSLRLFSDRRTEAELAHQIVALEKRMEEGQANKQEKNTQNAIDAEEFNSRLRIEPIDFDFDETTPLLAARP